MKLFTTILFSILYSFAFCQNKAELSCLEVGNSQIIINWDKATNDCGNFISYEIYYSKSYNTNYQLITTITDINSSIYTHNISTDSFYYFIKTNSACGTNYSDTSQVILLKTSYKNGSKGIAQLQWNKPQATKPAKANNYYYIYKEYPQNNWQLLDSTLYNQPDFIDTLHNCDDGKIINYKILLKSSNCNYISNIDGKNFYDDIIPSIVRLDSVSVRSNSSVDISWFASKDSDVVGYYIRKRKDDNSGWEDIGTTNNKTAIYFNFTNSEASKKVEKYSVSAFDFCNNTSLNLNNNFHNTILISDIPPVDCKREHIFSWNPYINWEEGVKEYNIFATENSGSRYFAGKVQETNFKHTGIKENTEYCYTIQAKSNNNRAAESSKKCIKTTQSQKPNFINADNTEILGDKEIKINFTIDNPTSVDKFELYTGKEANKIDNLIATITEKVEKLEYVNYLDDSKENYFYKLIARNNCNEIIAESNIANNIILQAKLTDYKIYLNWNKYFEFVGDIAKYNIYKIDQDKSSELIGNCDKNTTLYNLDINNLFGKNETDMLCYRVEAEETSANPYNINGLSKSNIACVDLEPIIYIPNTFTPNGNGLNDTFKPIISFGNKEHYLFAIYNRNNEKIFETKDINIGWNGRYNGANAQQGNYTYYLKITTNKGKIIEKYGNILLLYNN